MWKYRDLALICVCLTYLFFCLSLCLGACAFPALVNKDNTKVEAEPCRNQKFSVCDDELLIWQTWEERYH